MSTTVWKIRDKITGLFSKGGMRPSWSKNGKVWKQINHINLHFNDVQPESYRDAEVVEYQMNEVYTFPVQNFIDAKQQRADALKKKRSARAQKFCDQAAAARLKQYEELKKEFG